MIHAEAGNKESVAAFERLGISQQQLTAHSNDLWGMLNILADKFESMPDGALKNAEATLLLGKAGTALIPVLDQGAAGLEEYRSKAEALGIVLDKDGIEKMEQMHRALVDAKGAAEGAGLGFTEGLAPGIAGAAEAFANLNSGTSVWESIGTAAGRETLSIAAQFSYLVAAVKETIAEYD